jgi:Protein of unknown function (DUF2950)
MMKCIHTRSLILVSVVVAMLGYGCSKHEAPQTDTGLTFDTPDAAINALITALEKHDKGALYRVLGPDTEDLVDSGDAVADAAARNAFLEKFRAHHELVTGGPNDVVLQVGEDN